MDHKLKELSKPLLEYLEKNCDPYTYIVVSMDSIKIMRTELCTPIKMQIKKAGRLAEKVSLPIYDEIAKEIDKRVNKETVKSFNEKNN